MGTRPGCRPSFPSPSSTGSLQAPQHPVASEDWVEAYTQVAASAAYPSRMDFAGEGSKMCGRGERVGGYVWDGPHIALRGGSISVSRTEKRVCALEHTPGIRHDEEARKTRTE